MIIIDDPGIASTPEQREAARYWYEAVLDARVRPDHLDDCDACKREERCIRHSLLAAYEGP